MVEPLKFSVIMACHNAAPYIQQAIASVIYQTYNNWELIIINDASEDDSLLQIKEAALGEPRIKVLSFEVNRGAAASRNAAIAIAIGEWLAILDADDVFMPDKLERQYELIQQNSSRLVLIGAGCFHIDCNGVRGSAYKYPTTSKALKTNLHRMARFPPHSSLVYRKSAVFELGCFNSLFLRSQDYDLWLRLSEVGDFCACALPLIEYRLHPNNISKKIDHKGYSQLEYGAAARVCQMLRAAAEEDPSAIGDTARWREFMNCVAKAVKQSRYAEYLTWKEKVKLSLDQSNHFVSNLLRVLICLTEFPAGCIIAAREKVFGNHLPRRLFRDWNSRTRNL